jgi:hypothetical protein
LSQAVESRKPLRRARGGAGAERPVGSRKAFSAGFLRDLAEVWAEHRRDTMLHTVKTNLTTFFGAN